MKNFTPDFFTIENFIKEKRIYDYSLTDEKETYHIAYNVNDPFISIMGASIVSALENNKDLNLTFHIFTDGFSEENASKIETTAKEWHCKCILYTYNMEPFQDFHIKVERFSRITYGRLFMPKVLKEHTNRFLYIDADAIVTGSLKDLFSLNMNKAAMGAVSELPDAVKYRAGYLHLKSMKYFNDGIMFIDIPQWEAQQITEKAFSYQLEPKNRFLGQSQDVLNLVFDGMNYFLPPEYNSFGGGEYLAKDREAKIVHWTGRRKPWQMVLSEFDKQWRVYNELSPWPTIHNTLPIKKPENYHDFQQWGHYQKKNGNWIGYFKGIFWYAVLRLQYKFGK